MLLHRDSITPVNYSVTESEQSALSSVAHAQSGTAEPTLPPSSYKPLLYVHTVTVSEAKGKMDILK